MKAQELIVSCCCTREGASVQDIVNSSFAAFLKREVEKFARRASSMYDRQDAWPPVSGGR